MSQMNRGEALRCIQLAKTYIADGNTNKAKKFLDKSLRMYETSEAKALLASLGASDSEPDLTRTTSGATDSSADLTRNTRASSSSSRMSKDEEVSMIRKILRGRDYYSILGVPRDADEKQLKKAYRKLALKCHPDRNQAPGAEEAFKKLSKAYDCLRDPRQRNMYNTYGEDSPQMRQGSHSAQFQQMTPDDIFRMFFGGDFSGGGAHFHTRRRAHTHAHANAQPEEAAPMVYMMQLLPMLLVFCTMILPSILMFGGNNSSSNASSLSGSATMQGVYFSLDKLSPFVTEKHTARLGTTYYTQPQRRGAWNYQRYKSPLLEQQVESAYLARLIEKCHTQMQSEHKLLNEIKAHDITSKRRHKLLSKLMKHKKRLDTLDNKQCNKLFQHVDDYL